MKRFDCLSSELSLLGPHLLEASAGTGKTFSIEHIFVRLILNSLPVDSILAVTFTNAATRELKARIRSNLEKALHFLEDKNPAWEYLIPFLGVEAAKKQLKEAILDFDQAQIFTIHGFCSRMLQEFAFEAKVGLFKEGEESKKALEILKKRAEDFLENGISKDLLVPEQLAHLLSEFDSLDEIRDRLLFAKPPFKKVSFKTLFEECKAALHTWHGAEIEEARLVEDFIQIEGNYKKGKGDFLRQVKALACLVQNNGGSFDAFSILLEERGTLFDFLSENNLKLKAKEPPSPHYPHFFKWAKEHFAPFFKEDAFSILKNAWAPIEEKILEEEEFFDPDQILKKMHFSLNLKPFLKKVQEKYLAAIIDEFQDTDRIQWEIFEKLFVKPLMDEPELDASCRRVQTLYLVGDPKQSIYRFRSADIYTYLRAKDLLGEENLYRLDTNFRSSKALIDVLNILFQRPWLTLPKLKKELPYHPVFAGADLDSSFGDDKGALHFFIAEGDPANLFEDVFLPLAVREIESLNLKKVAILVKDRHQVEKACSLLNKRGIASISKSHIPLGKTPAFRAIYELFQAIFSPFDPNLAKIVMQGPFKDSRLSFLEMGRLLEKEGLAIFAQELPLDSDGMQIFELLFSFSKREGFSFYGIKKALKEIERLDAESGGGKRAEVDPDAVQVMTLHVSKGLEFDVVFALGLSSRTPESEEVEEINAEKMRQLYVAMTRAKRRLYVPLVLFKSSPSLGKLSPMELFDTFFENSLFSKIQSISQDFSLTFEEISEKVTLGPKVFLKLECEPPDFFPKPIYTPCYLSSFTAIGTKSIQLEAKKEPLDESVVPKGAQTGVIIHAIFEAIFGSFKPVWKNSSLIKGIVQEKIGALKKWEDSILEMVLATLKLSLFPGFCLADLEVGEVQAEIEFVFPSQEHFFKGFIDLIFILNQKIYFVDWKTNFLSDYTKESLENTMKEHDYHLQASLYKEAVSRRFDLEFGGAIYIFTRGNAFILC